VAPEVVEKWRKGQEAEIPEMKAKGMYLIGGMHTNAALLQLQLESKAGQIPVAQQNPRWWRYPAKVYAFPKSLERFVEVLQVLGNEDNQNYLLATPFPDRYRTCWDIFCDQFADRNTMRWRPGHPTTEEYSALITRLIPHCLPRNRKTAGEMAAVVSRPPAIQQLVWQLITGDYKLPFDRK